MLAIHAEQQFVSVSSPNAAARRCIEDLIERARKKGYLGPLIPARIFGIHLIDDSTSKPHCAGKPMIFLRYAGLAFHHML